MKPTNGIYQTATQVKVFSPEITNVREVDSVHLLEDSIIYFANARNILLSRGLSPWYDIEWKLQKLGRARIFLWGKPHQTGWRVMSSVRVNIGKYLTYINEKKKRYPKEVSDDKPKRQGVSKGILAVGLIHSRGVTGVITSEPETRHSKGLAILRKSEGKQSPTYKEKAIGN